jgi:hypothetical protein
MMTSADFEPQLFFPSQSFSRQLDSFFSSSHMQWTRQMVTKLLTVEMTTGMPESQKS